VARGWRDRAMPDDSWRPPAGMTRAQRAAEQDEAAGGRDNRLLQLPNQRLALASVYLRRPPKARRVYAYLRWSDGAKTVERYIGQVDAPTRQANLEAAWNLVREGNLAKLTREPSETSWASSHAVRNIMRANRHRDTRPEKALRSAVHALGLRYRVNARPVKHVRRTADMVFPGAKVAVFLDGCFWHGCPDHYRPAKADNREFWVQKIDANRRRDQETDQLLIAEGWKVIRVWEHEDPAAAAKRVANTVLASRRVAAARRFSNDGTARFRVPNRKSEPGT